MGGEVWSVAVIHRGTGRMLAVSGVGQSGATGRLAALAAERVVLSGARGALTMDMVLDARELELAGGIRLTGDVRMLS